MDLIQRTQADLASAQHHITTALPKLRTAAALEEHLLAAGIPALAQANGNKDGCYPIVIVKAPYEQAINALEHAGVLLRFTSETNLPLFKARAYEATAFDVTVPIVIQPPLVTWLREDATEVFDSAVFDLPEAEASRHENA